MGKTRRAKRQEVRMARPELEKSKFGRNRIVMMSSVIIAIAAFSIYFGVMASGEEDATVQKVTSSGTLNVAQNPATTPAETPEPSQNPSPKPTVKLDVNPGPVPSGPIKAKWIAPQITGDSVSIPISEVQSNVNIHFGLDSTDGKINFMAYVLDGEVHVRANVCPPCHSVGFSLQKDILVCDRCKTTFEAKTGDGIEGACVDYPKATVPYSIAGDNIMMSIANLKMATQNTIIRG